MPLQQLRNGSYTDSDDPGEPTTGKPRVSITDNEGVILSAIAAGRRVLEIGTGLGVSTRALNRYAHLVVTYDIDPWVKANVWPALTEEGVRCTDNPVALDRLVQPGPLVFIDADHDTAAVGADIDFARSLYPVLIVCHDAASENVARAIPDDWSHIATEHGLAFGQ